MQSSLTAGLMDWCEFPELGAMGDLLVTSTFSQGSVLVVQQYAGYEEDEDEDDNKDEEEGSVSNSLNSLEGSRLRATETVNDGGLVMEPFHKSDERV
ncbi:hypothetical protein JCGZ_04592 [Jatropha curcas]|nr:hypothetical protein JCGZ_04592 [Jatropha curcas]